MIRKKSAALGVVVAVLAALALLELRVAMVLVGGESAPPEKAYFSLAQNTVQPAPGGGQAINCDQLLGELEAEQANSGEPLAPAERQIALSILQAAAQAALDGGNPNASGLDPDGNGIACDEFLSGGGQPVNQPQPQNEPRPPDDLLQAGGSKEGPVPPMPDGSCPGEYPAKQDGACHTTTQVISQDRD